METRRRPCSVCRKWFSPDPRVGRRQRCCGPTCSRELHRRACARWNARERPRLRGERVEGRLAKASPPGTAQDERAPKASVIRLEVVRVLVMLVQDEMRRMRRVEGGFSRRQLDARRQDEMEAAGPGP